MKRNLIEASTDNIYTLHSISFDFAHDGHYGDLDIEDCIYKAIDIVTDFNFYKANSYDNYISYLDFEAIDYDPRYYPDVVGKETSQCNATFVCEMPIDSKELAYTLVDVIENNLGYIVLGIMVDGGYY